MTPPSALLKICGTVCDWYKEWGIGVDFTAKFLVAFRLVHRRICGTVYDTVYVVIEDKLVYGSLVRYVERRYVRVEIIVLRVLFLEQLYLVPQLPVASGDKYVHVFGVLKFQWFFLVFQEIVGQHADECRYFLYCVHGVGAYLFLPEPEHHYAV